MFEEDSYSFPCRDNFSHGTDGEWQTPHQTYIVSPEALDANVLKVLVQPGHDLKVGCGFLEEDFVHSFFHHVGYLLIQRLADLGHVAVFLLLSTIICWGTEVRA